MPNSFIESIVRNLPVYQGSAYRWVRNHEDARDIAQETSLRVWLCRERLSDPGKDSLPYGVTVAARLGIESVRGGARRARLEAHLSRRSPNQQAERSFAAIQCEQALRALRPRQRKMVRLFYYEGWTGAEIAYYFHVSEDVVSTSLSRARRKMRSALV